jgi:hypothetical protein
MGGGDQGGKHHGGVTALAPFVPAEAGTQSNFQERHAIEK